MDHKAKQHTRGWRHWSEAEARTQLAAFRRSGMSAAAFARSKGVSTNRLEYWKKRLAGDEAEVAFVPVTLPAAASFAMEITMGDITVRAPDGVAPERVAQVVVAIVRGLAC
jgi:hypothetical protein